MAAARNLEDRRASAISYPDEVDVPAAVVCARCGESECICVEEASRSGVVMVVPWENERNALLRRLWATAKGTTFEAEAFFELMPDGPIGPALRFALISELFASTGSILCALPFLAVLAPQWLRHVALDPVARELATRLLLLAIPSFALLLVIAHAMHGLALDRGARAGGALSSGKRALRFGLYAAGWDIVIGPIGAVVLLFARGPRGILELLDVAVGVPGRASRSFLRGTYRLDGGAAKGALSHAYGVAIVATVIGAIFVVAGAVAGPSSWADPAIERSPGAAHLPVLPVSGARRNRWSCGAWPWQPSHAGGSSVTPSPSRTR